jgi:hypothetical protein
MTWGDRPFAQLRGITDESNEPDIQKTQFFKGKHHG